VVLVEYVKQVKFCATSLHVACMHNVPFLKCGFTKDCLYQWHCCGGCYHQDVCCQGAFLPAFLNWEFGVAICQNILAKWPVDCLDSCRNVLWNVTDRRASFGFQVYGDGR
jgi:hypothetical protein